MDYQYPGLSMEKYTPLKSCLQPMVGWGAWVCVRESSISTHGCQNKLLYLPAEVKVLAAEQGTEGGISTAVTPMG